MDAENQSALPVNPNGFGAAALLAAGIGPIALAILAGVADRIAAVRNALIFYRPTGPLSGVTTLAVAIWLLSWFVLNRRWRNQTIALRPVTVAALTLLALSVLLTFPPLANIL